MKLITYGSAIVLSLDTAAVVALAAGVDANAMEAIAIVLSIIWLVTLHAAILEAAPYCKACQTFIKTSGD
jgi:hypothetical protein